MKHRSALFALLASSALAALSPAQTYCPSAPWMASSYWITHVAFSNLSHASTSNASGYEDWTAFSASIAPGIPTTLSVTVNLGGTSGGNNYYVHAFFDWNGNGVFSAPGEGYAMALVGPSGYDARFQATITAPASSVPQVRMRLIHSLSGTVSLNGLTGIAVNAAFPSENQFVGIFGSESADGSFSISDPGAAARISM